MTRTKGPKRSPKSARNAGKAKVTTWVTNENVVPVRWSVICSDCLSLGIIAHVPVTRRGAQYGVCQMHADLRARTIVQILSTGWSP